LCFQVGEFYESIGIDACVLVEYAGLNPFGGLHSDSVPRAGCPVMVSYLFFSIDFILGFFLVALMNMEMLVFFLYVMGC
jgi:hypothetical protein